jgi:16S rRNA (cytosine967-C5)-methyltransferase
MQFEPGQVVLDRCCGMGTKTMQIHELMGESGRVVAIDASEPRCIALRRLLEQRKVANVAVYSASLLSSLPELAEMRFDRVLIDVPCSNSGVLARRPEARYFQQPHSLKSLSKLQAEILADTAPFVKPGGLLVYSTCSIWPEENEKCIEAFLSKNDGFELLQRQLTLPSLEGGAIHYRDGGFVSVLRRI